jgi:subtilisin family serine protease
MDWQNLTFDSTRMNWGIDRMNILTKFWKEHNLRGQGIAVAVLDTGIDLAHPDLTEAVLGSKSFTGTGSGMDDYDPASHGNRSAGLIAARGRQRVFGVAPEAGLYVAKVNYSAANVAQAIRWACSQNPKPAVISFAGEISKSARSAEEEFIDLENAVKEATAKGILVVASVGNSSRRIRTLTTYPSAYADCVAIGASTQAGQPHTYSPLCAHIDFLAPGENMLTAIAGGGTSGDFDKTSAACSFAAGVLALLLQCVKQKNLPHSPKQVVDLVRQTADYPASPAPGSQKCSDNLLGCGVIKPVAALSALLKP